MNLLFPRQYPNAMPWTVLLAGFEHDGRRVPLVSQQGIFKPAVCDIPLSMRTAPVVEGRDRPYADEVSADGLLVYRYRGTKGSSEASAFDAADWDDVIDVNLRGVVHGILAV
jgi:hypothetical protein